MREKLYSILHFSISSKQKAMTVNKKRALAYSHKSLLKYYFLFNIYILEKRCNRYYIF